MITPGYLRTFKKNTPSCSPGPCSWGSGSKHMSWAVACWLFREFIKPAHCPTVIHMNTLIAFASFYWDSRRFSLEAASRANPDSAFIFILTIDYLQCLKLTKCFGEEETYTPQNSDSTYYYRRGGKCLSYQRKSPMIR